LENINLLLGDRNLHLI